MKKHPILGFLLAIGVATALVAGCSSDDDSSSSDEESSESADAGDGSTVSTTETDAGEILVDADGQSLYVFTEDSAGTSSCEGDCADAWPPLTVDSDALPEDLDAAVFSVIERPDGTFQIAAADQPLYRFAGDSAGEVNGQGSGGTWFLVDGDGAQITGEVSIEGAEAADTSRDYGY